MMEGDTIEEDFTGCIDTIDNELTGTEQERRYEHINTPPAIHIDEKWGNIDAFTQ